MPCMTSYFHGHEFIREWRSSSPFLFRCDFVNLFFTAYLRGWWQVKEHGNDLDRFRIVYQDFTQTDKEYRSPFSALYRALTPYSVVPLGHYRGQRVCFTNATLATLPRGINALFFNMPIRGADKKCRAPPDGLLPTFTDRVRRHLLHTSLDRIAAASKKRGKVRIIVINRSSGKSTTSGRDQTDVETLVFPCHFSPFLQHSSLFAPRLSGSRHILNHDELSIALRALPNVEIMTVRYDFEDKVDFEAQISNMISADILVGMHGSGLTHALWMPPWAAVVELLNCGDEACYRNLAALTGHGYFTGGLRFVVKASRMPKRQAMGALPRTQSHHCRLFFCPCR